METILKKAKSSTGTYSSIEEAVESKIKVVQNGVYRVDSATLAASGIAVGVGGIDPRNIQLFPMVDV